MTEIVITPPQVIEVTATSSTAYTITVTQPAAVTVTASLGNVGTVTSIATTAPITGGTITGSGTIGISAATTAAAGSMSASDKTKLDGIEAGAKTGDVVGPAVAVDTDVATFDGTTGKLIRDSGVQISTLVTASQVPGIENDAIWNAADAGTPNAGDKLAIVQDGEPPTLKSILYSSLNTHARQHAITSTSDHTSTATSGQMLKADANGLPVNATNTDAQVAAAVTASHAAVTVADSASIDMTLTGQQVSAAAIFGTGAGVVAEGNHTHYSYYTLQWGIGAGWNPVVSTTYYFGGNWLQNGTAARTRLYIPLGGTIIYASFNSFVGTTLGSAETSSVWVRLNNTTDTLISNVTQQDAAYEQFINSSLSIAVVAGDYVEIKWTTPAWVTNPTNTRQFGTIMVRV